MSWLFSQALVEASLAEGFLDGEPFVRSNTTPMPQAFLWHDKTMGSWTRFPSGTTFEPLTEDHGYRLWTWSVVASPVRTSVGPAAAMASRASKADFGWRWFASFAKWSPDGSTWKTRQCSLLGGLDEFSETWPRWGSMRDGECLALTTPELPTADHPRQRRREGRKGRLASGRARQLEQALPQVPNTEGQRRREARQLQRAGQAQWPRWSGALGATWPSESGLDRVADGVAHRVDRIRAIGNGQVPRVAATAWDLLSDSYSKDSESDSKNRNGSQTEACNPLIYNDNLAEWTGLEPATPGVTGPGAK